MSKNSNKRGNQSQSQTNTQTLTGPEETVKAIQDMPAETAEIIAIQSRQGRRVNALAVHNAVQTDAIKNKVQLLAETENAIAEVIKLTGDAEQNEETQSKVAAASATAAMLLFRGLTSSVFARDEVSDMLGRSFGWKTKQNGEDSKTPFGQGEAIRKRVVRAVDADTFVSGGEAKAFFEPLEREDVQPLINEVRDGKRSVFTLYDDLAKMKAEATGTRPKPAFDPKRVLGLAAALNENVQASVQLWHDTPGLFQAYAGLLRAIDIVGEEYAVAFPEAVKAA